MAIHTDDRPIKTVDQADALGAERLLRYATVLYAFGLTVHTADHFRRGLDVVTNHVLWAGNLNTVFGLTVIALVLMRHRLAPIVAVAVGLPSSLGIAAVHLLPTWSAFSDSLADVGVDGWSWAAVLIEIGGAAALAAAGAYALRRDGWPSLGQARPGVTESAA